MATDLQLAESVRDETTQEYPSELNIDLSPGQAKALDEISDWYQNSGEQIFRMFGPAGTGKTTIARLVPASLKLGTWGFGAFSGKAAQVLRSKGCEPAGTLHSMIYGAPINLRAERKKLENNLDLHFAIENPTETVQQRIRELREEIINLDARIKLNGPLQFPVDEDSSVGDLDLLIADEVSMVSDRMAGDILSTGVRILVLGDPEQLPPVRGDGFFTRANPDIMLTEIHRQALDSPVLEMATRIRTGGRISQDEYTGGSAIDYSIYDGVDNQILVWRRKTRWGAVRHVRNLLGRPPGEPVPGDRVMNLQNNKDLKIFNGQTFTVLEVGPGEDTDTYTMVVDDSGTERVFSVFAAAFTETGEAEAEKARIGWNGTTALFTFSQALTVHKAQGSEWKNVLVVDETRPMWSMESSRRSPEAATSQARRWLYTAVTRAAESVTLVRKS